MQLSQTCCIPVPCSPCLSSICCLSLLVKRCSLQEGAEPLWGWVEKGLQGTQREFLPLCCDPLLSVPSPWFSCRGCSRWRGCPRAGGTAINSLCPRSSLPHWECLLGHSSHWECLLLLLALWVQPFAVSMEKPGFGGQGMLWALQPGPKWEKGQYLQHKGPPEPGAPQIQVRSPSQLLDTAFPEGWPSLKSHVSNTNPPPITTSSFIFYFP